MATAYNTTNLYVRPAQPWQAVYAPAQPIRHVSFEFVGGVVSSQVPVIVPEAPSTGLLVYGVPVTIFGETITF